MAKRFQISQMYGPPYYGYHFKLIEYLEDYFSLLKITGIYLDGKKHPDVYEFRFLTRKGWEVSFTAN